LTHSQVICLLPEPLALPFIFGFAISQSLPLHIAWRVSASYTLLGDGDKVSEKVGFSAGNAGPAYCTLKSTMLKVIDSVELPFEPTW
jgi:hypothetical protein